MSQYHRPRLFAGPFGQLADNLIGNAAQLHLLPYGFSFGHQLSVFLFSSFGHHDHIIMTSPGLPFFVLFLTRIIPKGNLGNQLRICGGCNAGIECNPAGITAHHLYPHQTMMRLSRGSDTVNGFSSDTDRCIKGKSYITAIKNVVDGLNKSHYVDGRLEPMTASEVLARA